jgi:hypothetical protein
MLTGVVLLGSLALTRDAAEEEPALTMAGLNIPPATKPKFSRTKLPDQVRQRFLIRSNGASRWNTQITSEVDIQSSKGGASHWNKQLSSGWRAEEEDGIADDPAKFQRVTKGKYDPSQVQFTFADNAADEIATEPTWNSELQAFDGSAVSASVGPSQWNQEVSSFETRSSPEAGP